ncbi:MAG TPA: hypothetical protein VJ565_03480, partial [Dehalococcoidia bacterium]|nr:hypothetical protein [Dehalococcoidia bacterium]
MVALGAMRSKYTISLIKDAGVPGAGVTVDGATDLGVTVVGGMKAGCGVGGAGVAVGWLGAQPSPPKSKIDIIMNTNNRLVFTGPPFISSAWENSPNTYYR